MGSPAEESDRDRNERQHEVSISRRFWIGTYEVTQNEYEEVMGINPSCFFGGESGQSEASKLGEDKLPVQQVSWDEAKEFCKRLSALPKEKESGRVYRLPTETEWEYCCRAGTSTVYFFGENPALLVDHAWIEDNAGSRPHPVGKKKPNAWGLFDIMGNVAEWCEDPYFAENQQSSVEDNNTNSFRLIRGGSWLYGPSDCRSASRSRLSPTSKSPNVGFRVICDMPN